MLAVLLTRQTNMQPAPACLASTTLERHPACFGLLFYLSLRPYS